jgi:hypothetical protein
VSRRPHNGTCHICGSEGKLSYEHVPPEKAFNDRLVVQAAMREYLDAGCRWPERGKILQRGAGAYTLCERCNNNTGSWYGDEYVTWAQRGLELAGRMTPGSSPATVTFTGGHPLRFIKQAVTMLFSVNGPEFAGRHPALVKFVLDRGAKGLPPEYNIYMTVVGWGRARSSGLSAGLQLDQGRTSVVTEVAYPPFALLMTLGPDWLDDVGRITHFADCGYDEQRDVRVRLAAGEIVTPYPQDYRTREQVDRDAAASSQTT